MLFKPFVPVTISKYNFLYIHVIYILNVGNLIACEHVWSFFYYLFIYPSNTFQSAGNRMVSPLLHPKYISKGFFTPKWICKFLSYLKMPFNPCVAHHYYFLQMFKIKSITIQNPEISICRLWPFILKVFYLHCGTLSFILVIYFRSSMARSSLKKYSCFTLFAVIKLFSTW